MNRCPGWLAIADLALAPSLFAQEATRPAAAAFDKSKAMAGDWAFNLARRQP